MVNNGKIRKLKVYLFLFLLSFSRHMFVFSQTVQLILRIKLL
jgi:hypothetical protein